MDFNYANSLLNHIENCKSNRIQAVKKKEKKKKGRKKEGEKKKKK
jgi:hypothetical protein